MELCDLGTTLTHKVLTLYVRHVRLMSAIYFISLHCSVRRHIAAAAEHSITAASLLLNFSVQCFSSCRLDLVPCAVILSLATYKVVVFFVGRMIRLLVMRRRARAKP